MRLTAELITNSLSYNNALNERELDLRGHKIPGVENLGVAKDQECIDFTDNNISMLGNFPLSNRLQTLLCAKNRISTISENMSKSVPNLHTLVLTENHINELADLDSLQGFTKLTYLSLKENPVAEKENYRYWVLWRCPSVRFLDFQKVKDAERKRAAELFGTKDAPTELAQQIIATRSKGSSFGGAPTANGNGSSKKMKITDEEKKRFQILVKKAKTLAEVQRLEKALNEGRLPTGVMGGEAMDET
ncbi:U2 small nuclear ribonucleoprotein [Fulvia fulva]|uniref:U2 small nuclear ribonucleoprotein A' n=1 Tax=Passalora fulva TaxID=5499 RepID=A0A9Q8USV0_PASFU|nr:U2 small nuclear ribonucleoprotein [Fulvia fulva]KAK4617713.1 U2 small nuclear ribonucleoprotein [Fulvia fulva]KAK4618471.1 U2 small nuclear ribonucleoprotein [Fulvia fulva]UJO21130.1 U2 small nuclear ribonucleoprotein [Fulvia fulva]WPV17998.1 U2 small nuclear ribonucleoprotein [Fulvia fulva]WPV33177.1 U2 small nuclear ribonucleoprotein [Fulvia fulva]